MQPHWLICGQCGRINKLYNHVSWKAKNAAIPYNLFFFEIWSGTVVGLFILLYDLMRSWVNLVWKDWLLHISFVPCIIHTNLYFKGPFESSVLASTTWCGIVVAPSPKTAPAIHVPHLAWPRTRLVLLTAWITSSHCLHHQLIFFTFVMRETNQQFTHIVSRLMLFLQTFLWSNEFIVYSLCL